MRIALLTLHAPANYGSNLQAFAMVRLLESRGHVVELLDYRAPDDEEYYAATTEPDQIAVHRMFVKSFLPLTPRLSSADDVSDYVLRTHPDALVVGSDAVMRIKPGPEQREVNRFGNVYWLEWLARDQAASAFFSVSAMGSHFPTLPGATISRICETVARRDYVSVRDLWTKWMLEAVDTGLAHRLRLSPDPVFSLDARDTEASGLRNQLRLPDRYIVFSGGRHCRPPHAWIMNLRTHAHGQGVQIAEVPNPDSGSQMLPVDWTPPRPLSPWEWLAVIAGARGYIGTRFHPLVIALVHDVPFIAIDSYGHPSLWGHSMNFASKTFDLCYRLGLADHVLSAEAAFSRAPPEIWSLLTAESRMTPGLAAVRQELEAEITALIARLGG